MTIPELRRRCRPKFSSTFKYISFADLKEHLNVMEGTSLIIFKLQKMKISRYEGNFLINEKAAKMIKQYFESYLLVLEQQKNNESSILKVSEMILALHSALYDETEE